MGSFRLVLLSICTNIAILLLLLLLWCSSSSCMSLAHNASSRRSSNGTEEEDRVALLAFKARITHDPFRIVSSWNDSIPYCKWLGVRCASRRHPNRVRALNLWSSGLVGTIAPEIGNLSFLQEIWLYNNSFYEYGTGGDASTYGDVYSYGIFLLELFTRKRPTDVMFKDNFNLHCWAERALNDGVMAIVDPSLLPMEEDDEEAAIANITRSQKSMKDRVRECLNSITSIGVTCSAESPWDRMDMNDVVKELRLVRDIYLGVGTHQGR